MIETQGTICDWAEATFRKLGSDIRCVGRANEEMAEAVRAVTANPENTALVATECADAMIVLCRFGERRGVTLLIYEVGSAQSINPAKAVMQANSDMAVLLARLANEMNGPEAATIEAVKTLWRSLHIAIEACGVTAQEAIDAKMIVNRMREWKLDGTGHGYHVRAA